MAEPREDGDRLASIIEMELFTKLEYYVTAGYFRKAETLLAHLRKVVERHQLRGRRVELELLGAVLDIQSGNITSAERHLMQAILRASRLGLVWPFQARRSTVETIIRQSSPQTWRFGTVAEEQFFEEVCRRIEIPTQSASAKRQEENELKLERPTRRELELLYCLQAGMSNAEVSTRLGLSVSTIKWHLFNLYAKLDVRTRTGAVAKARHFQWLQSEFGQDH
jgi:LuxR family maltose regulon positive regulatory protein